MHKINLIPKEVKKQRKTRKMRAYFFIVFILIILLMPLFIDRVILELDKQIEYLDKQHKNIQLKVKPYKDIELMHKDYLHRKDLLDKYTENNISFTNIIQQIIQQKPEDIYINLITIDASNDIIIQGETTKNYFISELLNNLEKMKKISEAVLNFSQYDSGGKYIFEIKAHIKKG
jgi:Tfp pilus assembly protein PilN